MKITSVDIWTVVVPTIPGRVHSPEYVGKAGWDEVPKHIIRVDTDTEYYGLGETGRGLPIDQVREGARKMIGRDPATITLQDIFVWRADRPDDEMTVGRGPAYDAFEMAIFDLVGRVQGLPVHALLGGAMRDRVRADYWMGHQTPEEEPQSHAVRRKNHRCAEHHDQDESHQVRALDGPEDHVQVDRPEEVHHDGQAEQPGQRAL